MRKKRIKWKFRIEKILCVLGIIIGIVLQYCHSHKIIPVGDDFISYMVSMVISYFGFLGIGFSLLSIGAMYEIYKEECQKM